MGSVGTPATRRRRRLALVAAGSLALHALVLILIGSYAPHSRWRIRNLDQAAVRVELQRRLPERPAEQKPKPQPPQTRPMPAPPRPATVSAPPSAAPAPAPHLPAAPPPPGAPSPWTVGPPPALPPGFLGSLQAHVGCSHADLARMSASQRQACARQLAEGAADAPFIQAPIAPEKRAAFDRAAQCRKDYDDAPVPVGTQGLGLGYIPRLRDCGPKDH